ncbi:MAG: Na/Pi cotransporter family protein [Gracilibacteraceae bacterium]|jgi:phosphate:Na+ symporter|nr:Na/Pi cotransporter family protein [Gracilibacteraceae bacterium]
MSIGTILLSFFGGLGLFLFGINAMADGLQSFAGDRMRVILEQGTGSLWRGILSGALVTALIQSSSGTTVLTVGLVNAGFLSLRQAVGVIMGANIGTTITAYLIGINLQEISLLFVALGSITIFFFKNEKITNIGQTLFGFGLLFYGMRVMSAGMSPLREASFFLDMMANVQNIPILGVLIGALFTGVVQSSSATTGILQGLADEGIINIYQAAPILFGINIGTTVTALLAGIGAGVNARRAALTHFLFNVIGTLIFLPLFLAGIFLPIVVHATNLLYMLPWLDGSWEVMNARMQIAQVHGAFNILNTLILAPFTPLLTGIVTRLIKSKDETLTEAKFLEPRLLENLPVALANAKREVLHMGAVAGESLQIAIDFFFRPQEDHAKKLENREILVDRLQKEIDDYVNRAVLGKSLTADMSARSHLIQHSTNDIERVSDRSQKILELTEYAYRHDLDFTDSARERLEEISGLVREIYSLALTVLETEDKELAHEIIKKDDIIDEMEKELRKAHIARVNARTCNGNSGAVYLDILSNLERIGDHSVNLAGYVLGGGLSSEEN